MLKLIEIKPTIETNDITASPATPIVCPTQNESIIPYRDWYSPSHNGPIVMNITLFPSSRRLSHSLSKIILVSSSTKCVFRLRFAIM
jgi:hypothetical protein